jgi:hypothetical protein
MYTFKMEKGEALRECFRAALVLTGNVEGAEQTVSDATTTIRQDCLGDALLVEIARSALRSQMNRSRFSTGIAGTVPPATNFALLFCPASPHALRS